MTVGVKLYSIEEDSVKYIEYKDVASERFSQQVINAAYYVLKLKNGSIIRIPEREIQLIEITP